jgi:hypothetical protein
MDELTSIVTSTLEARGVLNKIRAELRANVFSAIQEQQGAPDSAPNTALETLQRSGHGQVAAKLMHELLLSCNLDYSLAVLLPEAGLTDLELPDRQALAGSLGLDAAGEEPLLAQLVRMHLKGGGAPQPATMVAAAAASASSPANASAPNSKSPARERVGANSTLRDLPSLSKPGPGGTMLGDLPSLGGRGAPAGGGGSPGGEQQDEEERRLDAIESKLAGLAGIPSSCSPLAAAAPSRLASGPKLSLAPVSTGTAVAADLEDEIDEISEIEDDFEDDVDDSNSDAAQSFGSANPPAPLMAGGVGSLNSSLGRGFDRSMDESMSPTRLQHELQARAHGRALPPYPALPPSPALPPYPALPPSPALPPYPALPPSPALPPYPALPCRPTLLPCPAARLPGGLRLRATRVQTWQGFDHMESVEPPRAAAPAARGGAWQPGM